MKTVSALVLLATFTAVSLAQVAPAPGTPPGCTGRASFRPRAGSEHDDYESGSTARNDLGAIRAVNVGPGSLDVPGNGGIASGSRGYESGVYVRRASCNNLCRATLADLAKAT